MARVGIAEHWAPRLVAGGAWRAERSYMLGVGVSE
jgi:hypothetical protein